MTLRRRSLWIDAGAVAALLVVAALLIVLAGGSPGRVWARIVNELVLSPYGWAEALFRATPLVFAGLAVALPLRAGLFNIGAEGQLLVGSFAAAVVGLAAASLPGPIVVVLATAGALAGGGLWGARR